mmetsp:Transcript_93218/g.266470  ORF Transcript_93218/g.266470 Transcript_93218/m.266470 type:complete len:235 (-) Transcript_93218:292-996(-)
MLARRSPLAVRPHGPIAAEISPPMAIFPLVMKVLTASTVLSTMMLSVTSAPATRPTPPPAVPTAHGALQPPPMRRMTRPVADVDRCMAWWDGMVWYGMVGWWSVLRGGEMVWRGAMVWCDEMTGCSVAGCGVAQHGVTVTGCGVTPCCVADCNAPLPTLTDPMKPAVHVVMMARPAASRNTSRLKLSSGLFSSPNTLMFMSRWLAHSAGVIWFLRVYAALRTSAPRSHLRGAFM